jgi:hypothetical protein
VTASAGSCATAVAEVPLLLALPPPDTDTVLVTDAGALLAVATVSVIGG